MHVVVVGCGRVGQRAGRAPAKARSHRRRRRQRAERVPPAAARGSPGDRRRASASTGTRLSRPGIEQADALAAVTSGDNSNILSARVARETFGIERVVARIYDPRRAAIYERLGIPTVATVSWTTDQVMRRLLPDAEATEWIDATGSGRAGRAGAARRAGPGTALAELSDGPGRLVGAVTRLGDGMRRRRRRPSARRATSLYVVSRRRRARRAASARLAPTDTEGHH